MAINVSNSNSSSYLVNASTTYLQLDLQISTSSNPSYIAQYKYTLYAKSSGTWIQNTSKTCGWRIKCSDLNLDEKGSFNATVLNGKSSYVIKTGTCYQPMSTTTKTSTSINIYAYFNNFNGGNPCYTTGTTSALNSGGWPITQNLISTGGSGNYKAYTISYVDNLNDDGVQNMPSTQYKLYNEAIKISSIIPTRLNYSFKNWKISSGSTTYAAGASYSSNANLTLNPVWSANEVTISYSAGDGSWTGTAPAAQTITAGASATVSSTKPAKEGYTFSSWTDGSTNYTAGTSYTFNKSVQLTPVFEISRYMKTLKQGEVAINNGTNFYGYKTYLYTTIAKVCKTASSSGFNESDWTTNSFCNELKTAFNKTYIEGINGYNLYSQGGQTYTIAKGSTSTSVGGFNHWFHDNIDKDYYYTLSFDVKHESGATFVDGDMLLLQLYNTSGNRYAYKWVTQAACGYDSSKSSSWQRCSVTFKIEDIVTAINTSYTPQRLTVGLRNNIASTNLLYKDIKLEYGQIATPYCPGYADSSSIADTIAFYAQFQTDNKIQIFNKASTPSTGSTTEAKRQNFGDLWYDNDATSNPFKKYIGVGSTYVTIYGSCNASGIALADVNKKIYLNEKPTSYAVGDYYVFQSWQPVTVYFSYENGEWKPCNTYTGG